MATVQAFQWQIYIHFPDEKIGVVRLPVIYVQKSTSVFGAWVCMDV